MGIPATRMLGEKCSLNPGSQAIPPLVSRCIYTANKNNFNVAKNYDEVVIKYQGKIFYDVTLFSKPTLRLLNSSTVVAISGGLRLHIAFLLAVSLSAYRNIAQVH